MGLERLAVVMQDVDSVFDIDTMKAIRDKICEMSGKKYQVDAMDDVSIRLITDHIRSSTFHGIRWCYAEQRRKRIRASPSDPSCCTSRKDAWY